MKIDSEKFMDSFGTELQELNWALIEMIESPCNWDFP
jgi:hypothetical protein